MITSSAAKIAQGVPSAALGSWWSPTSPRAVRPADSIVRRESSRRRLASAMAPSTSEAQCSSGELVSAGTTTRIRRLAPCSGS